MNNTEILEKLLYRDYDECPEVPHIDEDDDDNVILNKEYSVNGYIVRKYLSQWNKEESEFPQDFEKYIRYNEWTRDDFDYETECVIKDVLPDFMLDIYFEMKDFRSNSRNELLSTQLIFARMYGYPDKTQDEKAFCVYKYAIQEYLNNSQIMKE